jgi:hypothetical protein
MLGPWNFSRENHPMVDRLVITVLLLLFGTACRSADGCVVHDDCWNSEVGIELGRCAPKEVVCQSGTCSATCAQTCEVIQADVNPCQDVELICNEARDVSNLASGIVHCTGLEIACDSVDQCPLYLPMTPTGTQASWSCDAGFCRYPGFAYKFEK